MKKAELLSGIKKLKKLMPRRSTLPILDNVLNDNGTLTVSTLEVTHTINIGFDGKFLVNFKQFEKIVSKLPAGAEISIESNEANVCISIDSGAKFTLGDVKDADDYIEIVKCQDKIGTISESDVKNIKKAVNFVSDDDLRPVMTNVFLSEHIAATDAHKLLYFEYDKKLSSDILIRPMAVKCMNEADYNVSVSEYRNMVRHIKFEHANETIIFRETEGKYPNYKTIIPTKSTHTYSLSTKKLKEVVSLALITANECTHKVAFVFSPNRVRISSEDIDYNSKFSHSLPLDTATDNEILIGMKGTFLLDLLAHCGETVTLKMTDACRCILIDSDKLLMPMMLD